MIDFPKSSAEISELADELVNDLRGKIKDTHSAMRWTCQNISSLEDFFRRRGAACFFSGSPDGPEFLWDFAGYVKNRGILITSESEHSTKYEDITYDFDKLLYGRSPLKLMICRIDTKCNTKEKAQEEAEKIRLYIEKCIHDNCIYYSRGEVFVIYCVWYADEEGENQDIAYIFQVDGEPDYVSITPEQHFQPIAGCPKSGF